MAFSLATRYMFSLRVWSLVGVSWRSWYGVEVSFSMSVGYGRGRGVLPYKKDDDVPPWLRVSVGVNDIRRLLYSDAEFVCLVATERKGCVRLGCLGVGQGPKICVFRVVRYVFIGS